VEERLARAALTYAAEPGDPAMGALLRSCAPAEIVTALIQGRPPVATAGPAAPTGPERGLRPGLDRDLRPGLDGDGLPGLDRARLPGSDRPGLPGLHRALARWAGRLGEAPAEADLDTWRRAGIRLVCPGDPEWPGQLDVLGDARPWGLWARGDGDLRYVCLRSVSIVGTRSVTAYGSHVSTEMAATLAEHGWTVVSGGAKTTKTPATLTVLAVPVRPVHLQGLPDVAAEVRCAARPGPIRGFPASCSRRVCHQSPGRPPLPPHAR
jgi:DNA processing protein